MYGWKCVFYFLMSRISIIYEFIKDIDVILIKYWIDAEMKNNGDKDELSEKKVTNDTINRKKMILIA